MRCKRTARVGWLAIAAFLSACSGPKKDAGLIKMGFTPSESSEKVASSGKILTDLLEKKTGLKFQAYVSSDYTALVEAMRSGQVQIGWLAPFAFVLAEKNADARVLLKAVRHGQPVQYSAIIVRTNSGIKTPEDLKGRTIAWVDPSSSSGHILPKSALIAAGYDTEKLFQKQTWAGSHESAVLAVINGSVDAAATWTERSDGKEGTWTKIEKASGAKESSVKSIFVTPPMPSDTVSVAGSFAREHPDQVAKIQDALLSLSESPEGRAALQNLYNIEALVVAKSEEYEPLRKAAAKLGYSLGDPKK